jgi:hypothetical protein
MTEDLKKRIQQLGYELAQRDRQGSQAVAANQHSINAKLDEILVAIAKLQAAIAKLQAAAKHVAGGAT